MINYIEAIYLHKIFDWCSCKKWKPDKWTKIIASMNKQELELYLKLKHGIFYE